MGSITDIDGNFSINCKPGVELTISYVGYKPVTVKAENNMVVTMSSDSNVLDEVVVVGYGLMKKSDLTGSVSQIKGDELMKNAPTSMEEGLRGRMSGVNVISNDGAPGGGISIQIRGSNSFQGSTEPLYVIDGVPMGDSNDNTINFEESSAGYNNALSSLNPNDIASIEILKDASATAIYGSRGSNGVDFDMMPGFRYIWGTNNSRNKEFVWGAASNGADPTYCTSGLNNYFTPAPFGGSGCWIYMSHNCYNLYEEDDDRIVDGVFHYYLQNYNKGQKWVSYPSKSERYNAENLPAEFKAHAEGFNDSYTKAVPCMTKHYLGDITKPSLYNQKLDGKTNQDVILIRFAEAYLLRAEAEVEIGSISSAMADLDVIRSRAGASTYSGKVNDKTEARSLVLKERALELAMEFNRKFDLLRWGLYLDVMNDTQSIDCAGTLRSMVRTKKNLLYAIPSSEVAANKLLGGNNYGY